MHQLGATVRTLRLNHAPAAACAPTVDNGSLVGCSGDDDLAYSSPYASACLHLDECIRLHRAIGGRHRTCVGLEVWIVFQLANHRFSNVQWRAFGLESKVPKLPEPCHFFSSRLYTSVGRSVRAGEWLSMEIEREGKKKKEIKEIK